jgi:hypothetical protein
MIHVRPMPSECSLFPELSDTDYFDTYEAPLRRGDLRPDQLYREIMRAAPRWITLLMAVRDSIVQWFNIKKVGQLGSEMKSDDSPPIPGTRIDIFTVRRITDDEIVVGEDDSHLNFSLSLLKFRENGNQKIAFSTVVKVNNPIGKAYLLTILPFHKIIARTMLASAIREGRI